MVLPNTCVKGSSTVAASIGWEVVKLALPHARSKVSDRVTISAGIASIVPNNGNSPQTLITLADRALYRSKIEGRNRYCIYGRISVPIESK